MLATSPRAFDLDRLDRGLADETGRLTQSIEGRPLTAKYVVGRRVVGGPEEAFPETPGAIDALSKALFGSDISTVASREIGGDTGRFKVSNYASGNLVLQPFSSNALPPSA